MRKFLAVVAVAGLLATAGAGIANAASDMMQKKGDVSIGWWDYNAPVALRYMLTDNWELMGGIGFHNYDVGDDTNTEFAIALAANYRLIHANRAHLGLRPRLYKEFESPSELMALGADLAVEVEISSAVSVVAGHGLEWTTENGASDESDDITTIRSRAVTSSSVGFWVKLP